MTAAEALRQAAAEGLTLVRSDSRTGYRGVKFSGSGLNHYQARVRRGGKQVSIGLFATAEEAALCYARTPEGRAAAPAPSKPPPMTAEEALRQAEAEGLTLLRQESNSSGKSAEKPPDMPADVVVTLERQFVVASGAKRKLEERFADLVQCKRFMSDEEYAAKRAELMNEI